MCNYKMSRVGFFSITAFFNSQKVPQRVTNITDFINSKKQFLSNPIFCNCFLGDGIFSCYRDEILRALDLPWSAPWLKATYWAPSSRGSPVPRSRRVCWPSRPRSWGLGLQDGCEAIVHSTGRWLQYHSNVESPCFLTMVRGNAFNKINRSCFVLLRQGTLALHPRPPRGHLRGTYP